MKKYPIFNKYYNKAPRALALAFLIMYIFSGGGGFLVSMLYPDIPMVMKIASLAVTVAILWALFSCYRNQTTLKNARIGKHLKKYYGLEGTELVATLEAIEHEMENPVYSDEAKKKKYNAFFITENWLVGTDGVMLMRVNACKIADIVTAEPIVLHRYRKGVMYEYPVLRVKDKNDYTYDFWLRSIDNVSKAHDCLMNYKESI